jgi:hypothetical protein
MVNVASSQRLCGDEFEDGWVDAMDCIRLFYLNFVVFFVLGHRGSLVINLSYKYDPKGWWRGKNFSHPSSTPWFRFSLFGGVVCFKCKRRVERL